MELALGGNKVRKLEFILADALSKGSDTVIACGPYYSNHARLTATASAKLGLKMVIVTYPPAPGIELNEQGNILLNKLFGADICFVSKTSEADKAVEEIAEGYR